VNPGAPGGPRVPLASGFPTIESEHRLQLSLVNALEELLQQNRDQALIARTMSQLADFTNVHFLSEELVMRVYLYPRYEEHRAEHARLTSELAGLQRRVAAGEHLGALGGAGTLRSWLDDHIRRLDADFAAWCEQQGLQAH
jgi:hemerythrin